ncbi:cell wall-binding repeat-containing protein [Catenulispora sp. NL8]|uniref:Cell wall-binding repeat-containing protein n=1 Tax=Catenulispora pinistramenti TaxID=2705254 RepID=A0ABS5KLZ2_9ACTN|nr:cell wall-binding repeat-containing protein [Catenulispora pinistramenti]MBS2547052.1 cell wall-binding repeat-containing protein [Catenulispora pinistramenti]
MSRRASRVLASVGVLAAAAGAIALPSTAAQAAAAHVNGHIAWPTNTAGWSQSDADGSNVQTVTPTGGGYTGDGHVTQVVYSADGTKVAFAVTVPAANNTPASGELWIADASGANARRVLGGQTGVGQLAWSPDGKKIYFVLTSPSTAGKIDVVGTDGSGLAELPGQANCWSTSPTVAPNGRVVFAEQCAGTSMPTAVALDPGATTLRNLAFRPRSLAFSPDGNWIAYTAYSFGPDSGLFITPAAGGVKIQISSTTLGGAITWSPDGKSLLAWTTKANGSGGQLGVLNKVAAKANSPLVPLSTQADPDASFEAGWQTGASTAPARPVADRIGGADRVDTSVRASQWSFDAVGTGGRQAASAVITRSDLAADALAGNALAAEKDGPLFMTGTTSLDPRVQAELTRILPRGANVYILGGTRALSDEIDTQVGALGFTPVRLAGDGKAYADDRYGTAQAIADQITGYSNVGGHLVPSAAPHSVFVATGVDYPDALTAGAAAAQDPDGTGVVMLSDGSALLPWTQAYLATLNPATTHIYTVGGPATTAVAKAFPQWKGRTTPLAGANRYETAYLVATHSVFGPTLHEVGVATAANWPDALSGGALIGLQHGPLLLSGPNGLTPQEASVLGTPGLGGIAVFGGTSVVSDKALSATADLAFGVGGWDKGLNRQAPALK